MPTTPHSYGKLGAPFSVCASPLSTTSANWHSAPRLQTLLLLRRRLDPADLPEIPRPRARDRQPLALGVIHGFEIRILAKRPDRKVVALA